MKGVGVFERWLTRRVVVQAGTAALLFKDGLYQRTLGPGLHRVHRRAVTTPVPVRPQTLLVAGQEVLSADGFLPRLSAVASFTVADPFRAVAGQQTEYRELLTVEVQLAVRALAAARKAESLATAPRAELDGELLAAAAPAAAAFGLALTAVRLRDIHLPADLRRLMTAVEKARREGQAALERAHAEQAALRALANAARLLRNNPELQNLRLLQVLGDSKATTVALGATTGLLPLSSGPAAEPGA